jgi:hypothetical protein
MADFVAVIRRAVDGLANNTPEMRVRVYDKARSAVQRQLENMKPRPSDDMLRRQLDKLEAAIVEVEAEHAEAMPALDDSSAVAAAVAAPVVADVYEPEPAQAPEPEPVTYAAPAPDEQPYAEEPAEAYREPEPAAAAYDAPHDDDVRTAERAEDEPVSDEPEQAYEQAHAGEIHPPAAAAVEAYEPAEAPRAYEEPVYKEPAYQPAEAEPAYAEPQYEPAASSANTYDETPVVEAVPQPVEDAWQPQEPAPQPAEEVWQPEEVPPSAAQEIRFEDEPRVAARAAAPAWPDAPSTAPVVDGDPFADDGQADRYPADSTPQTSAEPEPYGQAPVTNAVPDDWFMASDDVNRATADPVHFSESLSRRQELQPELPAEDEWSASQAQSVPSSAPSTFDDAAAADIFSAHFDEEQQAKASAKMPSVADLPDLDHPPATPAPVSHPEDDDLLAEFLKPSQPVTHVDPPAAQPADPWNDLEELIGYDRNAAAAAGAGAAVGAGAAMADADDATAQSARRSDDELDELMAPATPSYRVAPKPKRNYGVLALALVGLLLLGGGGYAIWMNRDALDDVIGQVAGPSTTETEAPATQAANQTTPPADTGAATPQAPATSAPATPDAGTGKFTQRLLPNGSEVDDGAGGPPATGTGQSVAQLNAPGDPAQAPAQAQAPAGEAATPAAPGAPDTNPTAAPAVAGEKIFLYEERIGQSSPAAVEGTVSWSLQNEAGENGRPEPVVQGRINVPDRGLTALVTFKRNTDASLPASHLVEFVFSLPPGFEGGAIDNVQRISLKQTEQDRGDALIAVPAKITPDFHMIALNDFPDARARNMELLRSRNWIDVPLVYTTGRRALLTLQKGPQGTNAFNEAISQWAALAPAQGQ